MGRWRTTAVPRAPAAHGYSAARAGMRQIEA